MDGFAGRPAWRLTPHLYAWQAGTGPAADAVPPGLPRGLADAAGAGFPAVECGLSWITRAARGARHSGADLLAGTGRALRERGLELAAVFVSLGTGADAGTVEAVAGLTRAVAAELGTRVLNVVTVPSPEERGDRPVSWDGPVDRVAGPLAALGRALEPDGVRVCWHPHDESLRDDASGARRVLDAAGAAPLAVCLDVGWAERSGTGTLRVLDLLGDRVGSLHLRDLTADGDWCDALGEGVLDLPGIAARLTGSAFAGPVAVELMAERRRSTPLDPARAAADSARALAAHGLLRSEARR
ncbi:sugar phosphate isomerase/epimerase family protein [Streptacidiphilus cavernicola]|uniref:Sugar phosphate isomerase/epimerase family protein n=1 Tax=Streptacidiphilus cavernicola TaxID=3342716 RepID=A0ABV6VSG1_9ACTN